MPTPRLHHRISVPQSSRANSKGVSRIEPILFALSRQRSIESLGRSGVGRRSHQRLSPPNPLRFCRLLPFQCPRDRLRTSSFLLRNGKGLPFRQRDYLSIRLLRLGPFLLDRTTS